MLKTRAIRLSALILIASALLAATPARADLLYTYTDSSSGGPAGDGPVNAQATVSALYNQNVDGLTSFTGFKIVIQNNDPVSSGGEGQAISGIKLNIGSTLNDISVALVQDQGYEVAISKNSNPSYGSTLVKATGNGTTTLLHWGTTDTNGLFNLQTVGNNGAAGGKPNHLIVGALASGTTDYNPSYAEHTPDFHKTATFYIADSKVTGSTVLSLTDFSNFQFAFGTGPALGGNASGSVISSVVPAIPTPEPSTIALALSAIPAGLGYWLSRRRRATA